LLGAVSSSPFNWLKLKRNYKKHYESIAEEIERKKIFLENVDQIRHYERTHPDATFKVGINHLTDRRIEVNPMHT